MLHTQLNPLKGIELWLVLVRKGEGKNIDLQKIKILLEVFSKSIISHFFAFDQDVELYGFWKYLPPQALKKQGREIR